MRIESGYTLIEVIIVISILSLLTTLLLFSFGGMEHRLTIEQFIDQLQRDINWALSYADNNQQVLYMFIFKDFHMYFIQENKYKILKREYNKNFRIETNLLDNSLIIQANGTLANFGTLTIYYREKIAARLIIELHTGVIREEIY